MLALGHKKLEVWKLAIGFVIGIYRTTDHFPKTETYNLTNQLRRAAVSIASNIAEGASRSSVNERRRFFEIARSSAVEIDTQIEIALQLGFCSRDAITELDKRLNSLFAMLSQLIRNTR